MSIFLITQDQDGDEYYVSHYPVSLKACEVLFREALVELFKFEGELQMGPTDDGGVGFLLKCENGKSKSQLVALFTIFEKLKRERGIDCHTNLEYQSIGFETLDGLTRFLHYLVYELTPVPLENEPPRGPISMEETLLFTETGKIYTGQDFRRAVISVVESPVDAVHKLSYKPSEVMKILRAEEANVVGFSTAPSHEKLYLH